MKNTIKNFAFLDKIQIMQQKISKCFDNSNDIIYCSSIFVQLPTLQIKIVELNPLSFYKNEETITITITKENFKIESTRVINNKELQKLEKLFCKKQCTHRFILVQKENISMQNEADDLDLEFLENKEEREQKREWKQVQEFEIEFKKEPVINNPLINKTDE